MIYSSPILDLDEAKTIEAARLSVFMDVGAMETLVGLVLTEESSIEEPRAKRALAVL